MGLRVTLEMPPLTKEEVELGFIGLTVVLARRNEATAASATSAPAATRTRETDTRAIAGTSKDGTAKDASHMTRAVANASATGGTFNSSALMASGERHDVPGNRRAALSLAKWKPCIDVSG